MKNLSDKTKKRLIAAGGAVISVALLVMIGSRFAKEPDTEEVVPAQSTEISDVVIDVPNTTVTAEKEEEVTAAPILVTEEPQKDSGAVDTGTEQKIQADIQDKPTYTEEQLTDPTQKPNGEKIESSSTKEKAASPTATPTPKKTETASDQNTSGGLPGFDSVPDGGANQVIDGESDGDINKQVGTMD